MTRVRAAAVQAEPVWFDLAATTAKTVEIIGRAAAEGADLVAFPETWLPGYPLFLWGMTAAEQIPLAALYRANSPHIDGPEIARIREAAAEHEITVVLGLSERDHGSLYMAQVIIGPNGDVLLQRRKLKPTFVERTLFGEGDGSGLQVIDTPLGRLGALNCWEHLQPLTKYAMFSQDEQLHVAAWPSFSIFPGVVNALGPEVNIGASRQYAVEGQTFVLAPCAVVGPAAHALFADTELKKQFLALGGGYARIFGPDGSSLAEPLAPTEEGVLFADIDFAAILAAKNAADPVGHYSRPDVFTLHHRDTGRLPKVSASGRDIPPAASVEVDDLVGAE